MQLSNGAIKTSAPPPALMSQLATQELEGVDLETFDLSAFVSTGAIKNKTPDKSAVSPVVENFMTETHELFKLGQKYDVELVNRGNQALYELLGSIYGLALRIEESPEKDKIVEAIRKDLFDNHEIKIQSKSTPISAMVRYVIRAEKGNATRYTKVLDVARKENISVIDLPAYINRRGGLIKAQELESITVAKTAGDKSSKERTELIREYFQLVGITSKNNFQFNGDVIVHSEPKDPQKQQVAASSSFCVFVAHHVTGDEYKMISANDLGKPWEDSLVKYLGKGMPSNLYLLERGLRNFKRTISMDPTQPESLRKDMERQLAIPMKYKQTEVIEMDDSDETTE